MKVIVTKYLNVRVGKASVNAPCYQYLAPGSELEVDGNLYKGDIYEDNDVWLKDKAGNYYWSGGVEKFSKSSAKLSNSYPGWMLNLNIPEIWKISTGKNVGVAVIDTGIDMLNDQLTYNKKSYYVFDKNVTLQDTNGHGTHCAGLIGARNQQGRLIGVAPDCNLFVCKISERNRLNTSELSRYAEAINWCAEQDNIHVISVSYGSFIRDKNILLQLQLAVNNAVSKGKVLVCAVGNASKFNDSSSLYPASLKNTIGIGSIPVEGLLYPYMNKNLTAIIDGINIPSYDVDGQVIEKSGTSQSNAIVAGIVALIIEKKKWKYDPDEIKKIIMGVSSFRNYIEVNFSEINKDLLLDYFKL